MSNLKTIIKYQQSDTQTSEGISRTVGFIEAKHLFSLFKTTILDPNPRRPKTNKVTSDIVASLKNSSNLFQLKSKGLLIGTSSADRTLQRGRISLKFDYPKTEGILDGGHNMLAIGLYILSDYIDESELKKIKDWDELIEVWEEYLPEIKEDKDDYDFLVSVELITPKDDSSEVVEAFKSASIEICEARNNNSSLTSETRANQRGFYDEMKRLIKLRDSKMASRVEWKSNYTEGEDVKPIKVRDLVALAWLPLSVLVENEIISTEKQFSPTSIYSSKSKVSGMYDDLFLDEKIAKRLDDGKYILTSPAVKSALELLCDLPYLYDYLFLNMSTAAGNVARLNGYAAVKKVSTLSPYTQQKASFKMPDGFIVPLFYGLTTLMMVKKKKVVWITEPKKFLEEQLPEIMSGYMLAIEGGQKDPQKIAKSELSYRVAKQQFKFSLQNYLAKGGE